MVVSCFRRQQQDRQGVPETAAAAYVVDTLLCCAGGDGGNGRQGESQGAPEPAALDAGNAEMQVGLLRVDSENEKLHALLCRLEALAAASPPAPCSPGASTPQPPCCPPTCPPPCRWCPCRCRW